MWQAFIECWRTEYTGNASQIKSDRESSVLPKLFQDLALANEIPLQLSPGEAQNAMGMRER